MLAIKHYIPNTVTLLNLLCGCMAFISVFTGQIDRVPFFIAICLFADYFDGLLARLLKVSSPMGRELDSLADMVSFGVVPGAMLFYLINQSKGIGIEEIDFSNFETLDVFSVFWSPCSPVSDWPSLIWIHDRKKDL